jgi:hypothetical protein
MPRESPRSHPAWLAVLAAATIATFWLFIHHPWLFIVATVLVGVGYALERRRRARLRALAGDRTGDPLCHFVRAFPPDERDAHILRALYEELQDYCSLGRPFPLRPTDQLLAELEIDPDDLDDIANTVARRTGRDMKSCRANPYYGRVQTVRNLVAFLRAQPPNVAA